MASQKLSLWVSVLTTLITTTGGIAIAWITVTHSNEKDKQQNYVPKEQVNDNFLSKTMVDAQYVAKDSVGALLDSANRRQRRQIEQLQRPGTNAVPLIQQMKSELVEFKRCRDSYTYGHDDYLAHDGKSSEIPLAPAEPSQYPIELSCSVRMEPRVQGSDPLYWYRFGMEVDGERKWTSIERRENPETWTYTVSLSEPPKAGDGCYRIQFVNDRSTSSIDVDMALKAGSWLRFTN